MLLEDLNLLGRELEVREEVRRCMKCGCDKERVAAFVVADALTMFLLVVIVIVVVVVPAIAIAAAAVVAIIFVIVVTVIIIAIGRHR